MATERGSLGFGQRLVLLCAWLVSCGFVYVLGVYVGKGMHDRGPVNPGVSLPVDAAVPPAPPPDAQAPLTFYDVLGTQQGAPATARPAPAAPAARPAQADNSMTEQKLASAASAPAAVPAAAPPSGAAPSPTKATPPTAPSPAKPVIPSPASPPAADTTAPLAAAKTPVAPSKPPAAPAPAVTPPLVASAPAPAPAVHAATIPPASPPTAAGLPPQAESGRWTVYANPSRDQLAVEHERAALRAKGYPAEVVTLRRDGDTWYRIRVGRYASEAQAEEASRKLRTDGVGHAFVQSE